MLLPREMQMQAARKKDFEKQMRPKKRKTSAADKLKVSRTLLPAQNLEPISYAKTITVTQTTHTPSLIRLQYAGAEASAADPETERKEWEQKVLQYYENFSAPQVLLHG